MIAGIDSMTLIYAGAVPAKSKKKSQDFIELSIRANILLHGLVRKKATIILPTIAVSEVLVPVPSTKVGTLVATLSERFLCAPFDLQAATIAASLWSQHNQLAKNLRYGDRQVLKADTMIVSTAKAAGATDFYSHDKQCRALADLIMNAHDFPTGDPDDMFLRGDIERGEV